STTPGPPAARWLLPQERLQWLEVAIHDALLALAPYFDHRLRERVRDAALAAGSTPHRARLTAEAAMLTEAARRAAARAEPPQGSGTYRLHATEVSGTGTGGAGPGAAPSARRPRRHRAVRHGRSHGRTRGAPCRVELSSSVRAWPACWPPPSCPARAWTR